METFENYKVSILVPIYGVEKYIERCVISLFEQTYPNIEYIFVNDNTKDNSIQILKKTLALYPHRLSSCKIINHTTNRGLAASRNTAINHSTGEFILHVDSDDYIERNAIELLVKKQQETQADIINSGFFRHLPNNRIQKVSSPFFPSQQDYTLACIKSKIPFNIWGRLIRLSIYRNNHIQTLEGSNYGEDFQVMARLFYYAKKISSINLFLYHYMCDNTNSYTSNISFPIALQALQSFNVVANFFKGKNKLYDDAIIIAELNIIIGNLIIVSKGPHIRQLYELSIDLLNKIPKSYWHSIPISKRIILYLHSNYNIMKLYILIIRYIKSLISR